jgi:rare lipoprotein A
VRVNDRGPFHSDRIIDLSWAAANKLGFADKGTARVEVVALEAADPDSATAGGERWHLQAGAFGLPDAARALAERIGAATGVAAQVQAGNETPYPLHRVRLGPFNSRTDADAMRRTLAEAGFETVVVPP